MRTLVPILLFAALLATGVWWEVYKYQDCKMVGRSTLYCVMRVGQ